MLAPANPITGVHAVFKRRFFFSLFCLLLAPTGGLAQDSISREDLLTLAPVLATLHRSTPMLAALYERDGRDVVNLDMLAFLAATGAVSSDEPLAPEEVVATVRAVTVDQAVATAMGDFQCGDPFTVSVRSLEVTGRGLRALIQFRYMQPPLALGNRAVDAFGTGEYLVVLQRSRDGWLLASIVPSGREIGPRFFGEGCEVVQES